jgi:chromosome segregation ATPase
LQDNSRKLKEAEAVKSNLTKQQDEFKTALEQSNSVKKDLMKKIESKEEVLQCDNKKQEELQTTIDGLTNTLELLKWAAKWLCEHPKDVSTCKVQAVSVRSLRYLRKSGTSNLGQTAVFRWKFY